MNKFGARFKYSKLLCVIDNSSDAITSNITTVTIRRDLRVSLNSFAEYEIFFGNCIFVKSCDGFNIKSSGFNVDGIAGTVYLTDKPDSGSTSTGQIMLIQLESSNQAQIIKKSIGTIDYERGEIKLSPINITNTMVNKGFPLIEISGSPCSNDVLGLHDLYVQLDLNNTLINAIPDSADMESAASSYANGSLVRGEQDIPGSTTCDTPTNTVFTSTTASSASTTAATTTSTTTTTSSY